MSEDRNGVVRLPDDQLAALGQALREGAVRTPPGMPPPSPVEILSGSEASALRRLIAHIIDDELGRRQVLSETQIRAIAKEVAQAIYAEAIRGVEERLRGFFTEEGIEEIVLRILKDAGIKADKQHADETREIVEGMFRGYRRRNEFGTDFIKETIKALALLFVGAVLAYFGVKGVPH